MPRPKNAPQSRPFQAAPGWGGFTDTLASGIGPYLHQHMDGGLAFRTQGYETAYMNSSEFTRRARRFAKKTGRAIRFDPRRGKGIHGAPYVGDRRTTIKRDEIKPGTLHNMLRQLNIPKEDF